MTHRGPDDRGTYTGTGAALGVRRLSIVDVEGGHQPVSNKDGSIWAIQNGELYNHLELRRELRTHRFRSRCDTEILPHLYEDAGDALPERLRGKFALAVWNERDRTGLIARDRLGVKPLYYAARGDLLVFASELKGLLASGLVEPDLDHAAIDALLTLGFVPGPLTPLRDVFKLLPGHRIVVDGDGFRVERYWEYPAPAPDPGPTAQEWQQLLLSELEDAVRVRLMSDVPLGAMLSGGLDSSLIVALMARNTTEPVKTFSVGFADARDNELADAREVARLFGADHHELELTMTDATVDLADLVWSMDEPVADLSSLGFLALSELAARHVKVALAGQGADELFGGYRKHRVAAAAERWQRLPGPVRASGRLAATLGPRPARRLRDALEARDGVDRLLAMSALLEPSLREELYGSRRLRSCDGGAAKAAISRTIGELAAPPLAETLHVDGQLALVDDMLHYFDRASMARSLEVRVPFLDHKVVELSARIPTELKVHGLTTKHVLKQAALELLPERIVTKRKVGFFHGSISAWFRAQTDGAIVDYLLAPSPRYAELLERRAVERLVRRHRQSRHSGTGRLLLSILLLEVWLSTYLPRAMQHQRAAPEAISV